MNKAIKALISYNVANTPICNKCRSEEVNLTSALGPWFVCNESVPKNILFVGKVARGDCLGEEVAPGFEDVSAFGQSFIKTSNWPYWSYTKSILVEIFGDIDKGIQSASFTNMIKCNNKSTPDTTSFTVKENCLNGNGFIWKEIEALKPTAIVFYTNTVYDEYLKEFLPSYATSHKDNSKTLVVVGRKEMPWWDRSFYNVNGEQVLRFLRIGHPERKKKTDYVKLVSHWIKESIKS